MIHIGIICPSEIAFRRFLPSLMKAKDEFQFTGVAIASPEEWFGDLAHVSAEDIQQQQEGEKAKAIPFVEQYGGKIFESYQDIIQSADVDAMYIPLPPTLHFRWAKLSLMNNKHVFVEKPSTVRLKDTDELISLASGRHLALHENYMFVYHSQLEEIQDVVKSGKLGDVRLYRISFGFPLRQLSDFRYNKALGGGALLDAGGYCMKYAGCLLGETAKVVAAQANYIEGFEVDMFGSATMSNDEGTVVQMAFGMDNDYQCKIEIWGSKGTLCSDRILTAPAGFVPTYTIKHNQDVETKEMAADDAFLKSIMRFKACVENEEARADNYLKLHQQETLVEEFKKLARIN